MAALQRPVVVRSCALPTDIPRLMEQMTEKPAMVVLLPGVPP